MKTRRQSAQTLAWALSSLVILLSVLAWGGYLHWQFTGFSSYQLFPLLGLIAFSVMWAHYVVGFARLKLGVEKEALRTYFQVTSIVVLVALLLHPGLLIWQLWHDGFGLPPGSYLGHYVAPAMGWIATLGLVNLCIFLAYELWRWYENRPWWHYVSAASDLAMLGVFYHGLRLGSTLQEGWFAILWYLYGISLVALLLYKYHRLYGIKKA